MSTLDTARLTSRTMATITGAAHTMRPHDSALKDLLTRAGEELAGAPQGVAAARGLELAVGVLAREERRGLR